jgi:hypothetical protein
VTTADEVTLPGAPGTLEKSMPASEGQDATGMTGPADGPWDAAGAGPAAAIIIVATSSTTTPESPFDPRRDLTRVLTAKMPNTRGIPCNRRETTPVCRGQASRVQDRNAVPL